MICCTVSRRRRRALVSASVPDAWHVEITPRRTQAPSAAPRKRRVIVLNTLDEPRSSRVADQDGKGRDHLARSAEVVDATDFVVRPSRRHPANRRYHQRGWSEAGVSEKRGARPGGHCPSASLRAAWERHRARRRGFSAPCDQEDDLEGQSKPDLSPRGPRSGSTVLRPKRGPRKVEGVGLGLFLVAVTSSRGSSRLSGSFKSLRREKFAFG